MRDPRRVSNQTWLESTELATIWSQGITGDGGWKTSVFAMAAPIAYAAALMASASAAPLMLSASAAALMRPRRQRVGSSSQANRCYRTGAAAQSLRAL